MRLGFVYDAVFPWEKGGVQKRLWELSYRLADDHDVHWYGLHYWDGPPVIERDGVTFHGVAPPQNLYVDGRRSIVEALSFATHLTKPLLGADLDVIDCQAFPYFPCFTSKLGAARNDASLCITWHEVWSDYWYDYLGSKGAIGKVVERACARVPDMHLAVSDQTKTDLETIGGSDVRLLPNGIAMNEIRSAAVADVSVDLLFVGRLIPEKNPDLVLRAVDRLRETIPDVRCVLVGEGPERQSLERTVADRDLDENVTLSPFLESYEEVLGLMKAADTFVLPSRREGFGITVLEALACGTPVTTIDHPRNAARELVEEGKSGAVCEATPEALAEGVLRAGAVDGDRCVETAKAYDWDRLAKRAEDLYLEAI